MPDKTSILTKAIASYPVEKLRRQYEAELLEQAWIDTAVRESAARVLTSTEVSGDAEYSPSITDIVETLVKKIEMGCSPHCGR